MNYWEARLILSIQGNASPEEIKKAYAEKVRACNPETDPERWMRLHEAYKLLLSSAESQKNSPPPPPKPITPPLTEKRREEPDKKSGEFDEIFENLDEYIEKEEKDKLDRLTSELDRKIKKLLFASKLFPVTKKRLTEFMNSPEYAAACRDAELLPSLYPLFSCETCCFTAKAVKLMIKELTRIIFELPMSPEKLSSMNEFLGNFSKAAFASEVTLGRIVVPVIYCQLVPMCLWFDSKLMTLIFVAGLLSLLVLILLVFTPKRARMKNLAKTAMVCGGVLLISTVSFLYYLA